jgi:hypothetical protein
MSRTTRLSLFGVLTFVLCTVAFAPASLVRYLVPSGGTLTVVAPTGTLWRGSGDLGVAGTPIGTVEWSFAPGALLGANLGYDVIVKGEHIDLGGRVGAGASAARAELGGSFDTALLAGMLARYDLRIPGTIAVERLEISGAYGARLPQARGELQWSGGDVDYALSGREHHVTLPAFVGFVDSSSGQPEISVYQVNDKMPLLLARITQDGLATIGITKQFTKMLGEPWPGSEPDHAVVLEVGEKLF